MPEKRIFISYRRSDTASFAGRIQERITAAIPDCRVFFDVSTIRIGQNFKSVILKEMDAAGVFLILIGRDWLIFDEAENIPRVCSKDDYVRLEISWALQHEKQIIPVLVDDASMPKPNLLPEDIRGLTFYNAAEIRNSRFDDDFDNLVNNVDKFFSPEAEARALKSDHPWGRKIFGVVVGGLIGVLMLSILLSIHSVVTGEHASDYLGLIGPILLIPVSAIIGGYIGYRVVKKK